MNRLACMLLFLGGTVPFSAQQNGIEQDLELVAYPSGEKVIVWYGHVGRSYFVQTSIPTDHLNKWTWAPIIEGGNDEEISHEVEGTADNGFFRLQYTDQVPGPGENLDTADFDGDGISNKDEVEPGEFLYPTNPLNPDTDGDGLPDRWERNHGLDPNDSSDASILFTGSSVTNLEAFNSGVQANPNATPTDKDGDGLDNVDDADPNDATINWRKTADPKFVVIELPVEYSAGLVFDDLSPKGTVMFTRSEDSTRLVVDRNMQLHTIDLSSPPEEFVLVGNTLIGDKVFGYLLPFNNCFENQVWDLLDDSYSTYWIDRYYDSILDTREGFMVKRSRYGNDYGLGTHLGQLMGATDFVYAQIEGNGNIVGVNEYWRFDSNATSYGAAISFPETTVVRSATLIQEEENTQTSQPPTKRTWNLVAGSTKLLVSAENVAFAASNVAYPTTQHPVGVTSQGWVATQNQIWSNGAWKPLVNVLSGSQPSQATLLGILDTGLGVARVQYSAGPPKLVLLLPVEVVELSPKTKDENGNGIASSEKPFTGTPLTPFVEEDPATNKISHRELKVRIGEVLKGKAVTWTMEPGFIPNYSPNGPNLPPVFRGSWTTAAASHQNRFEASTAYGANGFTSLSQESGLTTVTDDGFTAIRVNIPPVGYNVAKIKIQIEGIETPIDLIDMEVPAIVVIDPGHGGTADVSGSHWNNATSPSGVMEKTMARDYGLALRTSLQTKAQQDKLNLRVLMTRTGDINPTGTERAAKARDNGADIIFIIHFNASDAHTARGTLEVVRSAGNVNSADDTQLANTVIDLMVPAIQQYDSAANKRYSVVNDTSVASDANLGNTATYHPIRAAYCEVEFIDFGANTTTLTDDAVDILLNTGPNANPVRQATADAMRDGILLDLKAQP